MAGMIFRCGIRSDVPALGGISFVDSQASSTSSSSSRRRNIGFGVRRKSGVARGGADSDDDESRRNGEENSEVDWDKEWTSFSSKPRKKKKFLNLDMEQYVSRRPTRSDYPLSEEVDPLRRTERSALGFWSSPQLFLGLIAVVVLLFIYMVVIVGPPPGR